MRKLLVAAVALVTCLAIGVGTASAVKTHRYPTSVTIHFRAKPTGDFFHGKVRSKRAACRPGRKVVVFRQKPGKDKKVGSDISRARGRWKVTLSTHGPYTPSGKYYAKVRRKRLDPHRVCLPARSRTITAP